MEDLPVATFPTAAEWEAWLADHHATAPGLWLKIAKRGATVATVSYAEALDGALCHGWIDGQKGALDDAFWRQRFTPRRPGSRWSQANRARAEALIAEGRMRPSGLRQVEEARADGRWAAAYAGQGTAELPEDLEQALAANPAAQAFFSTLDRANRYAILYRVQDARKPETRAARITKFVAMCAEGRRLHP